MGGGRSPLSGRGGRKSSKYQSFGSYKEALLNSTQFFKKHSNSDSWHSGELTGDEYDAIRWYTGTGYTSINKNMYTVNYDDMSPSMQNTVNNIESGLSKFELQKGIAVTRESDFKIFGASSHQSMTVEQVRDFIVKNGDHGVLQNDGFLSAGANDHGAAIAGSGLVIHFKVPPSVGAGAYVNPISSHAGATENEFLFNSKSLFKFDLSTLKYKGGKVHITATWVGRGKKQSFA